MIDDDDFESVFRKMIEHLMGPMGFSPEGELTVRTWTNRNPGGIPVTDEMPTHSNTHAEEIDLGDSYLILIENNGSAVAPQVDVEERTVSVKLEDEEQKFTMSFDIDIANSAASFRNGILEIVLRKTEDGNAEEKIGTIHVD
jgi:HSP20 family molecular chaperone IbpA